MGNKKLILVLNSSQEYIRHSGTDAKKYAAVTNFLFEAISGTYLPLLRMFENLEKDSIKFKLSLVLSPVLCTLLEDSLIQKQYLEWLDARIEFGMKEIKRTAEMHDLQKNAKALFEKAQEDKKTFEAYGCRLVKKFHEYQKKGYIEILATCGTDIFMPFYNDMPEVLNAQVEAGIYAYRSFFGEMPDGFWLPELGYYNGIEKSLHDYGMNYTILDSRSFLFGEIEPNDGLFRPTRFTNALVAFGRDYDSDQEIFGEDGYARSAEYRNEMRDVGFMLPPEDLEPFIAKGEIRYSFGYKYWNKTEIDDSELGDVNEMENVYNASEAMLKCLKDADSFVNAKMKKLSAAEVLMNGKEACMVVTINTNRLRSEWAEGIDWLEAVIRKADSSGLDLAVPKEFIMNPFELQRIKPYYGASCGVGYGENLLSSKNSWMMRYIRKASERMVDLADRFPMETGLKARLLNLGAKELMFCQSLGWAKMINDDDYPEYAEMRFKQGINDFTAVFDALGSNTVSTEWLTGLEAQHQIFPWMNYRIFCRKH